MDSVEVKLGNGCFASGQLYTALSRCRCIKKLRIDHPICPADVIFDQAVIDFYREIESGHPPKGERKMRAMSMAEYEEEMIRAYLSQKHGEKAAVKRRAIDQEDTDMAKSGTTSRSPEADSEHASEGRKITSSPDIDHLLVVYRNQNMDEKHSRMTKRRNGIGFNKNDAPILTEIAEKYLDNGNLTKDELATVNRLIGKYRKQWA